MGEQSAHTFGCIVVRAVACIALAYCALFVGAGIQVAPAWAVGEESSAASSESDGATGKDYSSMTLEQLKAEVKSKQSEVDDAKGAVEQINAKIAENNARIAELEGQIPVQQAKAARAARELYKMQQRKWDLVEFLLETSTLDEFFDSVAYIESVSASHVEELQKLRGMKDECDRLAAQYEQEKTEADGKVSKLSEELERATKARDEAQRKADLVKNTHLKADGADWKAGKEAFVKTWKKRLDRYLSGSPLAGQGEHFAEAAWDNHIDPRYSAAISNTESSKGRYCIRSHNAWGWGASEPNPAGNASSWSSWESAIKAHAKGLKSGYGYTISPSNAKKYCPVNWEDWYAKTVREMNSI